MMVDDIKITAMEMIGILQCLFNLDFLISLKKVNCVSNLMFLETSCDNAVVIMAMLVLVGDRQHSQGGNFGRGVLLREITLEQN